MGNKQKGKLPQEKDRHLDVPSEAERDKHIDFDDLEDTGKKHPVDKATEERQRQWKQGIEEGKEQRDKA